MAVPRPRVGCNSGFTSSRAQPEDCYIPVFLIRMTDMNLELSCFVSLWFHFATWGDPQPLTNLQAGFASENHLFQQHIYGVLILAQSETQLLNSIIQSLQTTSPAAHFLQPTQYWLQLGPTHHKYVTSQAKRNLNCKVADSPEFDEAIIYFSQTHNMSLSSICYLDWCLPSGDSPQLGGFFQTKHIFVSVDFLEHRLPHSHFSISLT